MNLEEISIRQRDSLNRLKFSSPVAFVYNTLDYALDPYIKYLNRYGNPPKKVVMVGMNPGPWGMVQTGIPFGDIDMVKNWLTINGTVGTPNAFNPLRPVTGYQCVRGEISGLRLWGWAKKNFKTADRFFTIFFIANYCPLAFFSKTGTNITPDKLPTIQKEALFAICDQALRQTAEYLKPEFVIGIGNFSGERVKKSLDGLNICTAKITHPSPANPRANKNWESIIEQELRIIGLDIEDLESLLPPSP